MSNLKVNTINDASGGRSAQLYGVSMRDGGTGWVNRIINGNMVIDQRNAGASVTPTTTQYVLDRWQITVAQASKLSVQQSSTAPAGFVNSTLITSLSAYSVGASDYFDYRQSIEGFNVADLAWGTASAATITLSFWVRSSLTGTFGGAVKNSAANRSYPFTYTISAANTWEQKSVTIAGDTSGTWVTNSGAGLILQIGLGVGSTFSGTAGAWAGANYLSATGATSVVGTNGATFYITGVQLEAGTVATPFERRDYGRELMMCQRYYAKSYSQTDAPGASTTPNISMVVSSAFTTGSFGCVRFPVSMRATPTVVLYSGSTTGALDYVGIGNRTITGIDATSEGIATVTHATLTAGWAGRGHYTASAEL